ncbi:MAG: hypothetical protein U0324_35680 [Polyangiales bacterium]
MRAFLPPRRVGACATLILCASCGLPPGAYPPDVVDRPDAFEEPADVVADLPAKDDVPTEDVSPPRDARADATDAAADIARDASDPDVEGKDVPLVRPEDVPAFEPGVATFAGGATSGLSDGLRGDAHFNNPVNVAVSPMGDAYVADFDNNAIRKIEPDGWVTTFLRQEGFEAPFGMVFASDGTMYLETDANDRGGRSNDTGTLWRLRPGERRATALARDLGRPRGMVVLPDGRLALSDYTRHVIETFDPDNGQLTMLAGTPGMEGFADGTGAAARFSRPYGMALRRDGALLVADQGNQRIRVVTLAGAVTTLSGSGTRGGDDGPAMRATFDGPQGVALAADGALYVSEADGHLVRRVAPDGAVTTVAGNRMGGFVDGPLAEAVFYGLEGIALSPDGAVLYLPDGNRGTGGAYHRMRRLLLP